MSTTKDVILSVKMKRAIVKAKKEVGNQLDAVQQQQGLNRYRIMANEKPIIVAVHTRRRPLKTSEGAQAEEE